MIDEEGRRRNYTRRNRSRAKSPKKSAALGFMGFQIAVCIIILLAALIIKLTGGAVYTYTRNFAAEMMNKNVTKTQLQQVFKNINSNLRKQMDVFKINVASSGKNSSTDSAAASSGTSKATSAAGSGAGSASKTSSSGSTAQSSSTASTITIGENLNGEGGEDIEVVQSSKDGKMVPPKTASLAPLKLSFKPLSPVSGKLTSRFGYRINPITKKLSFHTGIDLAAPEGTAIAAALPGKVADVGKNAAYGNYILLDNGGGITTFYGHCEKVLKLRGDSVKAGQTIATVGSTGMSTGFHVHFEIRVNNIRYNPLWLLG